MTGEFDSTLDSESDRQLLEAARKDAIQYLAEMKIVVINAVTDHIREQQERRISELREEILEEVTGIIEETCTANSMCNIKVRRQ